MGQLHRLSYPSVFGLLSYQSCHSCVQVDLPNRAVSTEEATMWCREAGVPYYETSAKDNTNVDRAFQAAVEKFKDLENKLDARSRSVEDTIDLKRKKQSSGGCC